MFYEVNNQQPGTGGKLSSALVVLNPPECRRLLAKAAAACDEVQTALKRGTIIIGRGITTAFFTEELLDASIEPKAAQTVGLVANGITNVRSGAPPCGWHVVRNGVPIEGADSNAEVLNFAPGDIFIKGANAIDPGGVPGIYVASKKGGTIGMSWPVVTPRGCDFIMPVSLEKLIPSVLDVARHTGIYHFKYSTGIPVKLVAVPEAKVITEIEAFAILAGAKAYHIGSGGIAGSEGSVHLSLEAEEEQLEKALDIVKAIKGEPPLSIPESLVLSSAADYDYDASNQLSQLGGS
ncbi:MAG: hypothetical protein K9J85_10835 [Desulfobacteraceae bacterium]|nr:hypothetical protein [Desulfobacteraceae bacterium]